MTLNLNIKANVDNLSLSDIYELLRIYSLKNKKEKDEILEFNGYKFKIETKIELSINYFITEIK